MIDSGHEAIAPARVVAYTQTSALGLGIQSALESLAEMRTCLRRCDVPDVKLDTYVGQVDGLDGWWLEGALSDYDCRNNRLAEQALRQDGFADAVAERVARYGPARVAVIMGTSTSGLRHTEGWYRDLFQEGKKGSPAEFRYPYTHTYDSLARFVRARFGLRGPVLTISTACSSGAKTFAAAQRYLHAGFCDAVLVGGVDSLCANTLLGFHSLGLVSPEPTMPWGANRKGLNLGEAGVFALLESGCGDLPGDGEKLMLLGHGESSDAYHISAPHPEGLGAELSMRRAMTMAGVSPEDIDYLNLHGTGTPANDRAEDQSVTAVFGRSVPASATKGWTGHALGAAGALEAVISLACLESGLLPGTLNTSPQDPALGLRLVRESRRKSLRQVLTNSFGFGGSNCSLVFGRRTPEDLRV